MAEYIWESDAEQIDYSFYLKEGNDPRDHILYHAAIVLGYEEEFNDDIEKYLREEVA